MDDLECSALEKALKEQVYRLAGQWEQGAQRLTEHLQDALQDLTAVRQQENDLLKRRVDLCHQELEDQVAELERSFHLKVDECKQQMLARIADQKAECEMAIRAKAESLLGILERVDSVPAPSSLDCHLHTLPASQRAAYSSPDHRLAHAACACYDNDDVVQRLNYLVPSPMQERKIPLAVQKYMNTAADRPQEWWKPASLTIQDGRKRVTQHSARGLSRKDQYDSPAAERLASLGAAEAQTTSSSLLFTSANDTGETTSVEYTSCSLEKSFVVTGSSLDQIELQQTTVGARWFGAQSALASEFAVSNCQSIILPGNRSVQVYNNSASAKCQVTWLNDTNYINLQAEMSGGSKDSWIISFPKDPAALTRFLCTSSTNKCLIEPQTACTPDSAALTGAEVETMSIVGGTSACSAGSGAASVDGTSLSYGLKATFYSSVYPNCANPSSTTQYALPDFTSLTPDASTPARCVDALDYQVYNQTIPTTPALSLSSYTNCYGMVLDGYVNVVQNTGIDFLNGTVISSFYNKYRVCVRYNGHVSVTLDGQNIVTSSAGGDYDATLVCQDDNDLQQGLLPLTVEYASDPTQQSTILQLFIIPISTLQQGSLLQLLHRVCTDVAPSSAYTCAQQASFGKCNADFMFSSAASTAVHSRRPMARGICTDEAPNDSFTCAQLEAIGSCDANFMFVAGAPAGGYCAATCSRCPLGSTPAAAAPAPVVIMPTAAAPVPAPAAAACVDLPPNEDFSCAQLLADGACGAAFMFIPVPASTSPATLTSASPTPASPSPSVSAGTPTPTPYQVTPATPEATPSVTLAPVTTPAVTAAATPAATAGLTPAATPTIYPAPTTTAVVSPPVGGPSTGTSCTDVTPDSQYTCAEQASMGHCNSAFMFGTTTPSPTAAATTAATPTATPTETYPYAPTVSTAAYSSPTVPLGSSPSPTPTPEAVPTSTFTPFVETVTAVPAYTSPTVPLSSPPPPSPPPPSPQINSAVPSPSVAAAVPSPYLASPAVTPSANPPASPVADTAATPSVTPAASSPAATAAVPSPSSNCLDIAPDSTYNCQQQMTMGNCNSAFMFSATAPAGGYCAATCGRCPSAPAPAPASPVLAPLSPPPSPTLGPANQASDVPTSPEALPATPTETPAETAAATSTPTSPTLFYTGTSPALPATPTETPTETPSATSAATNTPTSPALFYTGVSPGATPIQSPGSAVPVPTGTPAIPSPSAAFPEPLFYTGVVPDIAPDSLYTCAQQRSFGSCSADFMFIAGAPAGGYCAATSATSPPATSPPATPAATPAPTQAVPVANAPEEVPAPPTASPGLPSLVTYAPPPPPPALTPAVTPAATSPAATSPPATAAPTPAPTQGFPIANAPEEVPAPPTPATFPPPPTLPSPSAVVASPPLSPSSPTSAPIAYSPPIVAPATASPAVSPQAPIVASPSQAAASPTVVATPVASPSPTPGPANQASDVPTSPEALPATPTETPTETPSETPVETPSTSPNGPGISPTVTPVAVPSPSPSLPSPSPYAYATTPVVASPVAAATSPAATPTPTQALPVANAPEEVPAPPVVTPAPTQAAAAPFVMMSPPASGMSPLFMPGAALAPSFPPQQTFAPYVPIPGAVDCCLYAVNMGYHSSVGNTTAAVTTDNTSAIAIACPTTSTVLWQIADLVVTTASSPGAGNVTTIYDVTNSGGNDTTYVAKVVLEPSYQGLVTVSLASQSFNTTSGDQITLSAAPLTYRKQTACIPVVTTASEYT
ncbi:hypothetical protein WJX79_007938 [Trebouxia sp. C0005]